MKMGLTIKQSHMKKCIAEFIEEHGHSPTYRELASVSGNIAVSNVHRQVHALHESGHITMLQGQERSIAIVD